MTEKEGVRGRDLHDLDKGSQREVQEALLGVSSAKEGALSQFF